MKPRPLDPYLDRFGAFLRRQIRALAARIPGTYPWRLRNKLEALRAKYAKRPA